MRFHKPVLTLVRHSCLGQSRLRTLIGDNYYKMRDNSYSAWDESMLKNYLTKNKVEYEKDAKKSDLINLVKDSCKSFLSLFSDPSLTPTLLGRRLRCFFLPLVYLVRL
jgi:hypothetical protein